MRGMANTQDGFGTAQINDQSYEWVFELRTGGSQSSPLGIKKGGVKKLVINDDIHKWYHYGFADLSNAHSTLDKADNIKNNVGDNIQNHFSFRNDEQMFLYVKISPNIKKELIPEKLDSETFTMEFLFSIIGIEDIPGNSEDERVKRIFFEDIRHNKMKTQMSQFSTRRLYDKLNTTAAEDESSRGTDAEVYTGLAIKDLLSTAIGDSAKFTDNFDEGSTKTFYTSPHNEPYSYDLNYLLASHLSSDATGQCKCFLKASRFTSPEKNKFSLIPINDLYANSYDSKSKSSGPYMTEIFHLTNSGSHGGEDGPPKRTQMISKDDPGIYEFPDHSLIYHPYKFTPPRNNTNASTFISRETNLYKPESKEFHIRFTTQRDINQEHMDKYTKPSAGSNESTINSNELRNTNENRMVSFALTDDTSKADKYAMNDTMLRMMFQGRKLTFNCKGMTSRRSMRFMCVEHPNKSADSPYEKQILGQYLVLRVAHNFDHRGYTNTIEAVTPNNFKPMNQSSAGLAT
jgi:hypothetical protein